MYKYVYIVYIIYLLCNHPRLSGYAMCSTRPLGMVRAVPIPCSCSRPKKNREIKRKKEKSLMTEKPPLMLESSNKPENDKPLPKKRDGLLISP